MSLTSVYFGHHCYENCLAGFHANPYCNDVIRSKVLSEDLKREWVDYVTNTFDLILRRLSGIQKLVNIAQFILRRPKRR